MSIGVYEMQTLIFGAKSSPCSALYVKDENTKEFAATKPDAVESIQKIRMLMIIYLAEDARQN